MIINDENAVANGDGGSFAASPGRKAAVLGSQVGLGYSDSMSCLDQNGFGIPISLANAPLEAFASRLIVAWADPNQRRQVSSVGKRRHIPTNLGKEDFDAAPIEPSDGIQTLNGFLQRLQPLRNLLIQPRDGLLMLMDQFEKFTQEQAMMIAHLSSQRWDKCISLLWSTPQRKISQHGRIILSPQDSSQNVAAGLPHHIGKHRCQLEIRILQDLLEPVDQSGPFLGERCAQARQVAQFPLSTLGNEAGLEQSDLEEFRDPFGIFLVRFMAGNPFETGSVNYC